MSAGPVCELQIKTLLHDAWGAKTHDLTYKPAGRIGAELLESFELLGTQLANLEIQSDTLRASIVKTASVRETKRRKLQVAILRENAAGSISKVPDAGLREQLEKLHATIGGMSPSTPPDEGEAVLKFLLAVFGGARPATMRVMCYLAAVTQRLRFSEQAQDAIRSIEENGIDDIARLRSRGLAALTAFSVGEVGEAIDIAEAANGALNSISLLGLPQDQRDAFNGVALAMCSSLAY